MIINCLLDFIENPPPPPTAYNKTISASVNYCDHLTDNLLLNYHSLLINSLNKLISNLIELIYSLITYVNIFKVKKLYKEVLLYG